MDGPPRWTGPTQTETAETSGTCGEKTGERKATGGQGGGGSKASPRRAIGDARHQNGLVGHVEKGDSPAAKAGSQRAVRPGKPTLRGRWGVYMCNKLGEHSGEFSGTLPRS